MDAPSDPVRSEYPVGPASGSDGLDSARVAELFDEFGPEVFRFLLGMLRDPHQAQDALQATFVKSIEQGRSASAETIRGWLFRVAYREAITIRRAQDRQRRLESSFGWLVRSIDFRPTGLDDPMIRRERIEAVREALAELPENYLTVVKARIFEEKSFAQIAKEQQIPIGTALTRMRRALDRLSRRLRDENEP